ncbi:hypothetical protein [Gloeobacter violaceus]|uniref:hypothetical protein n=1 Tax=Gloeobacter violaceus TaxID=33072 RepID=UPI000305F490|nr:hypothetical protein [Gloeobacter violaceus]
MSALKLMIAKNPMSSLQKGHFSAGQPVSEHDVVLQHLRERGKLPPVAVGDCENLDSKYLFPDEPSTRPTEYNVVTEYQRRHLSADDRAASTVAKVLG